ncbi:septum formation family protein [Nocardioides sp. cx-173]|uniref:septum formation family protein n=1 Tax=Nocardioides sp. cx-173 TaxID=2898796 RepID=UPI001E64662B|nr:septum formation family protein [Nocardioides sp. cx-173]MCD4527177.1 septum formation family protein [Nocardioides sp. cx-173]UGB40466.1 septum formation family protein [Nocardioides sp. cx-173]
MRRALSSAVVALLLALSAGCSGDETDPGADPTPTPKATATAVPGPAQGACYQMTFEAALAATSQAQKVACSEEHTAMTYLVGRLDTLVDGHLLAVDSDRVLADIAATCQRRLGGLVGGTRDDVRLSMLRPVWFTPTLAQADAGASWYRCDVIAVAGQDRLAPLTGRLAGVLDTPQGRNRWGMCGTAQPDSPDFERVLCSAPHSWRAIRIVDLGSGRYPGAAVVRERGQAPCEDAGREVADDALNYQWGYEWPTREQWQAGQTYGRCWAPD